MKINVISTEETKITKYFNTQTDQFNQESWADLIIILNKEKRNCYIAVLTDHRLDEKEKYRIREIPGNLPEAEKDTKD